MHWESRQINSSTLNFDSHQNPILSLHIIFLKNGSEILNLRATFHEVKLKSTQDRTVNDGRNFRNFRAIRVIRKLQTTSSKFLESKTVTWLDLGKLSANITQIVCERTVSYQFFIQSYPCHYETIACSQQKQEGHAHPLAQTCCTCLGWQIPFILPILHL